MFNEKLYAVQIAAVATKGRLKTHFVSCKTTQKLTVYIASENGQFEKITKRLLVLI